jgi:hypothetical protein
VTPSGNSQLKASLRQRLSHAQIRRKIGALDDFNVEMRKNFCKRFRKLWSLISAVGEQRLQKWKHVEQCRHHENAAIAILNVGRMNDGVEQETYCVDKECAASDLSATSSLSRLAAS